MMTDHTPEHSKTHQTTITGNENGWTATCTCGFHSTQTSRRATAMNAAADHKEAQR